MTHDIEKLFPDGFDTWIQIVYVYEKTKRLLSLRLKGLGLSSPQHELLANLRREDGLTQQELARRMMSSKGNVTGLINRLSDRGLVERIACEEDARSNRIRLTSEGRKISEESLIIQAEIIREMLGTITREEEESLYDMMRRFQGKVAEMKDGKKEAA